MPGTLTMKIFSLIELRKNLFVTISALINIFSTFASISDFTGYDILQKKFDY